MKEAENWFLKAAEQNDKSAQYNLGVLYYESKQLEKAQNWYEKAAVQGHVGAQEELSKLMGGEK